MPVFNHVYMGQQPGQPPPPSPNFVPTILQQTGPLIQVQIEVPTALAQHLQQAGQPIPAPVPGFGLLDTGATISAVDNSVVQSLGVQSTGIANVGTAGGTQQQPVYPIRITLPAHKINFDVSSALGATLSQQGIVALLGRDFLQHFVLVYNGLHGMILMAL